MEIIIAFLTGVLLTAAVAKRLMVEMRKEIEQLKDFDVWKEWKNESEN